MNGVNDTIKHLTDMYLTFNKELDANLPEDIVFTLIPNRGKKGRYLGWFAQHRWINGETKLHEVNIVPEFLDRTVEQIAETMIHEITHLKNNINGVIDCLPNQYHKKSFKKQAEAFGLKVERAKNKGYAYTSLGDRAKDIVDKYMREVLKGTNPFVLHRVSEASQPSGPINNKKSVAIDKTLADAMVLIDGDKLSKIVDKVLRKWVAENEV